MGEEMSLPSAISPTDFAFELVTPFGGEVSKTQQPSTEGEQTCDQPTTDTVMQGFVDGVEKSFCMEWQLNPSTGEQHNVIGGGEGEGGVDEEEDELRRSMSVYSDLVLDEIAHQQPSWPSTSASGTELEKLSPEERRARRPVLKLDT